jgi:hypothetical protein
MHDPFSTSPYLTNNLDNFLQDDSPDVTPMLAPLSASHVHPEFLLLAAADSQIAPGTEAGGPTVR